MVTKGKQSRSWKSLSDCRLDVLLHENNEVFISPVSENILGLISYKVKLCKPVLVSPTLGLGYSNHRWGQCKLGTVNSTASTKTAAVAAAKSLQSCLTLRNPIDGRAPGSAVPGILQARTLEWVAISFSSAWKWKVKVKPLSSVWLFVTPWTVAHQAPLSMGFSWTTMATLEWVAISFCGESSWPRDGTWVSRITCIAGMDSLPTEPPGKCPYPCCCGSLLMPAVQMGQVSRNRVTTEPSTDTICVETGMNPSTLKSKRFTWWSLTSC